MENPELSTYTEMQLLEELHARNTGSILLRFSSERKDAKGKPELMILSDLDLPGLAYMLNIGQKMVLKDLGDKYFEMSQKVGANAALS